jgi:hypothetical protein
MSKILVIALLAINILMAGFHVVGANNGPVTATPARTSPADPDLPQIRLVGEENLLRRSAAPALQCYTVGPFETEEAMWRVHDVLYDLSADLRQRRTEALMELGYWVALPAFDSFAAAGAVMRELQQAGLEDMAVINNDPGVYYLSLGYFLDERNARRRRDQLRELGFEAVTRLQRESQPRWWLDFAQAPGTGSVDALLQPMLPPGLNRGIPCPTDLAGL